MDAVPEPELRLDTAHVGLDGGVALTYRSLAISELESPRTAGYAAPETSAIARFKVQVGTTPADHVESLRIEAACRLLETTHSSIGHVAVACGFGAAETMNRTFRRRLGTTPGEHRRHFGSAGVYAMRLTGTG